MQLWITQITKAVSLWSQKCVVIHVIQEPWGNCSPHFCLEGEKLKRPNVDTPQGSYPHSTLLFAPSKTLQALLFSIESKDFYCYQ